jgi:urease accessory protein
MGDGGALEAFRLADSALPVGTDSVSFGLEQFVADGRVETAADVEALLETYLRRQVGPADLVALRAAHAGAGAADLATARAADTRLSAVTLAAELRESAVRAGDRLLALERDLDPAPFVERYAGAVEDGDAPGTYPVALAVVGARAGVAERRACLLYCHGFLTGCLGAAQRLLSLGHTDAQRVLDALAPTVTAAVDDSADRSLDRMEPFAPLIDVLSADHERATRRLFLS